jgi:hypothetical protein
MTVRKGNRIYRIELTDLQIEALNLEQEAFDYVKQERLENRIDQALERDVPELLKDRIKNFQKIQMRGIK